MDEVKRKVYLDLFASPTTLLPVVGGVTALMASWAIGGSDLLNFFGAAGFLGGVGMFSSRLIFGLEKLTQRAYEYTLEKKQSEQEAALQHLARQLESDQDTRTERCLAHLRSLYETIRQEIDAGKVSVVARDVMDGVDRMFQLCVAHLENSFALWQLAQRQRGPARQQTLQQREELIEDVIQSIRHLEQIWQQMSTVTVRRNKSELARIQAELDETLRAAKRAEEITEAIGRSHQELRE